MTEHGIEPLGKALEKQTKKQVDALNSFNLPNKTD